MKLIWCFIYVALIGMFSHVIGQVMPRDWIDPDGLLFRSRSWEQNGAFYVRLKIRKWKDKLPDASKKLRFLYPKRVDLSHDEENLRRMIEETCVAEFIHFLLIILSLGVTKIWSGTPGWICWLLCVAGNLPFIMIQRFNRPRLRNALKRALCQKVH